MSVYEGILNSEEELRAEYRKEFAEEIALAHELFDIFFEANDINLEQWHLEPERRVTLELINRTFNSLHAGLKLILEGMPVQGQALLRDTIECANHIKLFEEDSVYRDRWCKGEVFFPRDIQNRMKKLGIPPPSLNKEYKPLSQAYEHPSKVGVAAHTLDWYPSPGEHIEKYLYGGIKDVYQTRSAILLALIFTYEAIRFIWIEMYPINKGTYPQWHERLAKARNRINSLETRVIQEEFNYRMEQYTTIRKIIYDHLKLL